MNRIKVQGRDIGGKKTFIIAEAGCNFENDFARAKEMVRAAAAAGADAIKFQTFVPEKVTTRDAPKFWDIEGCPGDTQYEEFRQMPQLSFARYKQLKEIADDSGIIFFSTPSDEGSADMLEKLDVPLYKISSMDITHMPLLRHVARKGKPIVVSTGASTIDEIREAVRAIESEGNSQIVLLHCTTNYPTRIANVNLNMMKHIAKAFPRYPVGYSDHTRMPESLPVLAAAVAMGARVVEKHFTFDRTRPGYDHEISADYDDLRAIVDALRTVERAGGLACKKPIPSEERARRWARRSVVAEIDIPAGAVITRAAVAVKRPGTGIEPGRLADVIGKRAKLDIRKDEVITREHI